MTIEKIEDNNDISGRLHFLIISFLSNCSQLVSIEILQSKLFGVPQRSIMTITLFLIYVNDAFDTTHFSKASVYADDTVFTQKSEDIQSLEQLM